MVLKVPPFGHGDNHGPQGRKLVQHFEGDSAALKAHASQPWPQELRHRVPPERFQAPTISIEQPFGLLLQSEYISAYVVHRRSLAALWAESVDCARAAHEAPPTAFVQHHNRRE